MNAKHYLTHLVIQHKRSVDGASARQAILKQAHETLSAEHVTAALKERLLRKRRRIALQEELRDIERMLPTLDELDPRTAGLKKKAKELSLALGP